MTPFSTDRKPMPGVETQANIINTILMENFITRTQTIWTIIEIFFLSLAAGWIFYSLTTRESILSFLFFLLSVAGIYLILLFQAGIWIDAWPLLAVILGNYLIVIVRKLGFLFRALDGEIKNLSRTQKFAPPLPQNPDEEGLMRRFFSFLTSLLKVDNAILISFEQGGKKLVVRETWGEPEPAKKGLRFSVPPILAGLSESLETHCPTEGEHFPWWRKGANACLILPLAGPGKPLGFLVLGRNRETPFQKYEIATGEIIAYHLSHAIRKLNDYDQALDRRESSIHFLHPRGMEKKINSLEVLSRAVTYEQVLLISMLESVADGVIVFDLLGNILICNPRAREIIGLDTVNFTAGTRQSEDTFPVNRETFSRSGDLQVATGGRPEDRRYESSAAPAPEYSHPPITAIFPKLLDMPEEEFSRELQKIMRGKTNFSREVTIKKNTYILSLSSISRGKGIAGGIMAVFTEITYLKELDRLRAETMAMLTHEIKNPLGGIQGFCELFLSGDLNPEEISEYIHLIKDSVDGLQKLVVDYLATARLESGARKLNLTP
ncbi:MAG: histidine kinase dimerization/phospho-acceptor domain-containing protein, partial [Candidatus Auribacterota bacterium]|nr:histidine kinase dimerization/phospho-acceptor domain-containing protein [Candidatus Auribacterota bacterium]